MERSAIAEVMDGVAMTRKPQNSRDTVDVLLSQWEREIPDQDFSAFAVFGRLHRGYIRYATLIGEVFERHGINMAQFDVLTALRRSGAPYRRTAGELASIGLITTGGVTLRLDRLETAGLVIRERDAEDRRVVYAQLTEAGLKLIDEVAREHFTNELRMLSGLSKSERTQLAGLLSKLERSLEAAEFE
jgi:DNA-binding MarR family transcriptional regulator